MLVGIGDAAVVLFLIGIIDRIGIGIAALPELLDEVLAFLVRLQPQESLALGVRDDIGDVLAEPLFVGRGKFLQDLLLAGLFGFAGVLLFVGLLGGLRLIRLADSVPIRDRLRTTPVETKHFPEWRKTAGILTSSSLMPLRG